MHLLKLTVGETSPIPNFYIFDKIIQPKMRTKFIATSFSPFIAVDLISSRSVKRDDDHGKDDEED